MGWNYGDILDLHEALDCLEEVDPQAAQLVKLGKTYADRNAKLCT